MCHPRRSAVRTEGRHRISSSGCALARVVSKRPGSLAAEALPGTCGARAGSEIRPVAALAEAALGVEVAGLAAFCVLGDGTLPAGRGRLGTRPFAGEAGAVAGRAPTGLGVAARISCRARETAQAEAAARAGTTIGERAALPGAGGAAPRLRCSSSARAADRHGAAARASATEPAHAGAALADSGSATARAGAALPAGEGAGSAAAARRRTPWARGNSGAAGGVRSGIAGSVVLRPAAASDNVDCQSTADEPPPEPHAVPSGLRRAALFRPLRHAQISTPFPRGRGGEVERPFQRACEFPARLAVSTSRLSTGHASRRWRPLLCRDRAPSRRAATCTLSIFRRRTVPGSRSRGRTRCRRAASRRTREPSVPWAFRSSSS